MSEGLAVIEKKKLVATTMTFSEARECVAKINYNINETWALFLELYERKGWQALGYESWRDFFTAEFGIKQAYAYFLLSAAKIARNLSTIVENSASIPESHLRPLAFLSPEKQREVYQKAVETAPEGKVTARHIAEVAQKYKPRLLNVEPENVKKSFRLAYHALLGEIEREVQNGWKQTDKNVAIRFVQTLMETIE